MRKLKIGAVIALIIFALALIVSVVGLYVVGHLFDSHFNSALKRIEQKVPHLMLSGTIDNSSLTKRSGKIYFKYQLPEKLPFKTHLLEGACDYELNLGLWRASFDVQKNPDVGNLDSVLQEFNLEPINYHGRAEASLWTLNAEAAFKLDSFKFPLSDGMCHIGENSVYMQLLSQNSVRTEFASGGIACRSNIDYNQAPAYDLLLQGLSVKARPVYANGKLNLDGVNLGLKNLQAEASTLYLIGFPPTEKVNDPSVREGFALNQGALNITVDDADANSRRALRVDGTGNLAFAFPVVHDNVRQTMYEMKNLNFDIELGRADFISLIKRLLKGKTPMAEVYAYLDPKLNFKLNNFGYEHQGESLKGEGVVTAEIEEQKLNTSKLQARFEGQAGKKMVEAFSSGDYANALQQQVERGAVDFDGANYHTVIAFKDGQLTLNGIAPTSSHEVEADAVGEEAQ
jgi:hypothetical protein